MWWCENAYENTRRVVYGEDGATFVPVCSKCHRYVKADEAVRFTGPGGTVDESLANATCKKCGRTTMLFEGFI